jgi:hypothetical protein
MARSATLINIFELPEDVTDEEFVAWWLRTRDFLNARVGPIPTALHRALGPDARFRFVNVAEIEDVDAWRAALTAPDFPGRDMPGRRVPGLYEVIAGVDHIDI